MTSSDNSPNTAPPTSSSPPPSSPMVSTRKHVTRTYGSKRAEAPPSDESPDADRSFGTLVDGDTSITLSSAARLLGIDENPVSSQDTKVDDDDDEKEGDAPERQKYRWSWMAALKQLDEADEETESTPALPISRHSADAEASPSPPASRSRGAKSKGKRPSVSPKKPHRFPLSTIRSDSRTSGRASAEPEVNGSDGDRSPSPSPPKQRRRTSGRTDAVAVEDSESEPPRGSSSKSRGEKLDSDASNRASPAPAQRKRKITAGRKPTAKAIQREEEEIKKNQARIAAERHVEFPVTKQPTHQYHISAFVNSFQAGMSAGLQKQPPPNHSSEPEDIQEWSSPIKQVVPLSKRKPAPPPADIDEEIGLEILPPGVEESRLEPRLSLNQKQSPRKARIPGQRPKDVGVYKRQVNQALLTRHNNQKSEIIQKKESAWKEKGGSILKPLADNRASLREYLEQIESVDQQHQAEDDDDGSDEEYRPGQDYQSPRSASPSDEEAENNPPPPFIPNPESTASSGDDTEEHDENVPPTWNPRATRNVVKRARINDSDDEEGDGNSSRILVPSTSTLDVREHETKSPTPIRGGNDRQSLTPADGETDKENVDDNKENAAILASSRSAFSAFASPRVWKAPSSPTPSRQLQSLERPLPEVRSPLSELRTEDKDEDVFGLSPRRRLSTAPNSSFGPPPLPAPLFGAPAGSDDDDDDDDLQPAPLMKKGFSQLFGTAPDRPLAFGESPRKSPKKGGFDAFRKGDDEFGLSLSLDAKLQPALEVSSTALRRADDIFQNEQEIIMQAAQETTKPKKPQMYIDENGFLTQSRPAGTNPQAYYPTTQVTPLTVRKPLGTLAVVESPLVFSDPDEPGSPSPSKPARRLRRRGSDSSAPGGGVESGSPLPPLQTKRNAFEILGVGAQKTKEKKPLKKSEFVEAEAQESDEDDGFGFKKKTTDEEERDSDADEDKPVEGLVDDTIMDEVTLAGKLVQEKYKEHQEQDDAQLEKQAKDIIEGKKRAKRRGFDLGSDESGSEDEDADRRRRKSIKKPRFDDGKLEGIGGDIDPSAFLRAYNSNLEDTELLFPVDEDSQMAERGDEEDDDEDEELRETISAREIEAQVRKAAKEKKYDKVDSFNPSDTSFMDRDSDDDEPSLRTREVVKKSPKVKRMRDSVDAVCFQSYLDDGQRSQEQSWVKNLGSSNVSGLYQGPSGGAVTAAGARAKGKSSRMVTKPSNPREERRKPVKEASMLVSALRKGKAC